MGTIVTFVWKWRKYFLAAVVVLVALGLQNWYSSVQQRAERLVSKMTASAVRSVRLDAVGRDKIMLGSKGTAFCGRLGCVAIVRLIFNADFCVASHEVHYCDLEVTVSLRPELRAADGQQFLPPDIVFIPDEWRLAAYLRAHVKKSTDLGEYYDYDLTPVDAALRTPGMNSLLNVMSRDMNASISQ